VPTLASKRVDARGSSYPVRLAGFLSSSFAFCKFPVSVCLVSQCLSLCFSRYSLRARDPLSLTATVITIELRDALRSEVRALIQLSKLHANRMCPNFILICDWFKSGQGIYLPVGLVTLVRSLASLL
jgi:hypothetical protein